MTFKKSYSKTFDGITPQQIWIVWSDVKNRPAWDDDTEWAKIDGEFQQGNTFTFKPKGGPRLRMKITECTPNKSFTDYFKLPFAQLYGTHELEETPDGLCLTTTMVVQGPLYWLWQKILVEKIVASLPHQTELLAQVARTIK